MKYAKDTSERDARILAAWANSNGSVTAAAGEAGVHWDVAARVIRAAGGVVTKYNRSLPDSPERDEETRTLRAAGMSWRNIAEKVYGNRNAEGRIAKRHAGLNPPDAPLVATTREPTRLDYGWPPLPPMHPVAIAVLRDAGVWL